MGNFSANNSSPAVSWVLRLPFHFLSLLFFTENEGKTASVSYHDKVGLVALTQQVLHGPFAKAENVKPLGALDVIGKDRR